MVPQPSSAFTLPCDAYVTEQERQPEPVLVYTAWLICRIFRPRDPLSIFKLKGGSTFSIGFESNWQPVTRSYKQGAFRERIT